MAGAESSIFAESESLLFFFLSLAFVGFTSLLVWLVGLRSRPRMDRHEEYDIVSKSAGSSPDQD